MNPCQIASRTGTSPNVVEAEVVEVLGVLRPDERPVEVVDPGVVRALEADRRSAPLLHHRGAPMAAHVVEGAERRVAAPDHDERLVVDGGQEVGAGGAGVLVAPDHDPVAPEPLAALEVVDGRVVVGPAGQQRCGPVRLPDGGDLVLGQRR